MNRIEYLPPPAEVVEQFARDACQALAVRCDSAFGNREVVDGLTGFLKVLGSIAAKHLNQQGGCGIDSESE